MLMGPGRESSGSESERAIGFRRPATESTTTSAGASSAWSTGFPGRTRPPARPSCRAGARPFRASSPAIASSAAGTKRRVDIGLRCSVIGLIREQISHVRRGVVIEARDKRRDAGIRLDLRRIEVELPSPDQARLLAQIDDLLEEALEDVNAKALLIAMGQTLKHLRGRQGWERRPYPSGAAGLVLSTLPPPPALTP